MASRVVQPGKPQKSFDKQYVRDWLTSPASGWDRTSGEPPPELPGCRRRADAGQVHRGVRAPHRASLAVDGGDDPATPLDEWPPSACRPSALPSIRCSRQGFDGAVRSDAAQTANVQFAAWRTLLHGCCWGCRHGFTRQNHAAVGPWHVRDALPESDWVSAVVQFLGTLYFNAMTIRALVEPFVQPAAGEPRDLAP